MIYIKKLSRIYHFLGGIAFALILIASVAFLVITGTILESLTESHLFASHFIYGNPLFIAFLILFFVNILFSSLRRWPFKLHHIPFLITHLGLLMILSGTFIKILYGVQGNMGIVEGGGSSRIFIPNSYTIQIEKRAEADRNKIFSTSLKINRTLFGGIDPHFSSFPTHSPFFNLDVQLLEYAPHSEETLETWVKNNHLIIAGIAPLQLQEINIDSSFTLTPQRKMRLHGFEPIWNLYALRNIGEKEAEKIASENKPAIVFMQNSQKDICFFACTADGVMHKEEFPSKGLKSLFILDQGFAGYGVQTSFLELETPVTAKQQSRPPSKKLEENLPKITLYFTENGVSDKITLTYDRYATGLKWPVLKGKYRVRFQPEYKEIPYHLRLRNARQINYPHSGQAFSYESDILIENEEATLSMNHVYETWDGYRFYLANIFPADESAIKQVQIVVNHDPVKYILTYPGAIILSLGILLLFWWWPYKNKGNKNKGTG